MKNVFVLLIVYCISFGANASLDIADPASSSVTTEAATLNQEVNELPDVHFLNKSEQHHIDLLLSETLDAQATHIADFSAALAKYHKNKYSDKNWEEVDLFYESAVSLSKNKEKLLELSSRNVRDLVVGFGPEGVLQFKSELALTRLNIQYFIYHQVRAFKLFISDFFISPIPVFSVLFKILLVLLVLKWWLSNSKRLIDKLREQINSGAKRRSMTAHFFWYVSRAQRAIACLIAITLSLRILATLPSLQHLIFLEIFTWWILGGAIAVSFIVEFTYRHSRKLSPELVTLRLSTIRFYVWGFITTGLISQISAMTLGKGTIYEWIASLLFLFYVLLTIYSLHKWKNFIFSMLKDSMVLPLTVRWAIHNKDRLLLSTICTAITGAWLLFHTIQHSILMVLSQYQIVSHMLAYLFRIEVAKQTDINDQKSNLKQVCGERTFNYVQPGSENSILIPEYAAQEMGELAHFVHSDKPAMCVLSGERGIGTTTMLRRLLHDVKNATPIFVDCPSEGYESLLEGIATQLGLDNADEQTILSFLQESDECYLMAIDNVQRLVKPQVGGLASLMRLTNLMRLTRKSHRIILAIEKSSWRFVDRARGERLLFDLVTFMPRWKEKEVNQLLQSRVSEQGEFSISFEGLALPRQWDKDDLSEEEHARNGFYRILWDYSDGNPTVSLSFFRRSLFEDKEGIVKVRLFVIPSSDGLEKMPKPMLAILRSIVQLETASPEELRDCTQLSIVEVISTLRYFQSRGYIEWAEGQTRISDLWFRNITDILHRQHLLVK
ncbi:ATP-binding protein [Psychromonas sp. RZ22]|uniref:AAA family ATPase n=1 Tax=Psychromonas algarum TaxID=2555643 RepID=UPI001067C054|nr:AAA family ATPase [Psychromonas sp. RZ22]TEW55622.1 ATP-binding protein [Psychromonas sp. RZ22]